MIKPRVTLSPRYQISLRSMLNIKHNVVENDRLETLEEMDSYFNWCQKNKDESQIVYKQKKIKIDKNDEPFAMYFNKKEKKYEALHEVVHNFSQHLLETLFIALVANEFKFAYRIDKVTTITNILSGFGVNSQYLKSLSEEQKREYIIHKFNETIDQLLMKWKQKVDKHMNPQRIEEPNKDVFHWMELKTKYSTLKIKLKQILFTKLNEFSNIESELKRSTPIQLKDIQKMTMTELLRRMDPMIGQLLGSLKCLSSLKVSQLLQYKESTKRNKMLGQKVEYRTDFLWNNKLELNFQKERQEAKVTYVNKINSSNFNKMGFAPLTQAIYKKYDGISSEELNFMHDTSSLLARCVDHQQFQQAVNKIDRDQISILESNLAESIIENHEYLMQIVQKARLMYLQNKNNILKSKQKQRDQLNLIKQKLLKQKQLDLKKQSRYNNLTNRKKQHNYFVYLFARKVMDIIFAIRSRNQAKIRGRYPITVTSRSRSPRSVSIKNLSTGPQLIKINQRIRLKAIILIQAMIRRFLARCKFKKYIKSKIKRAQDRWLQRKKTQQSP